MTELDVLLARTAVIGGSTGPRQLSCADYNVLVTLARKTLPLTSVERALLREKEELLEQNARMVDGRIRAENAARDLLEALARVRDERDRALAEASALSEKLDTLRNSLVMIDVRTLLREVP